MTRRLWAAVIGAHLLTVGIAPFLLPTPTDPTYMRIWASLIVERGLLNAYNWSDDEVRDRYNCLYNVNYLPDFLYIYGPLAELLSAFDLWPINSRILADLFIRLPVALLQLMLIFALTRTRVTEPAGLSRERVLLFVGCNPICLLVGPVWGQLDVVLWGVATLGVLAVARGATGIGGIWTAIGIITKPQILLFLPVLGAAALRRGRGREIGRLAVGTVVGVIVLAAPFLLTSGFLWAERGYVRVFAENSNSVTVTGYNMWWVAHLATGIQLADERIFGITAKNLGLLCVAVLGIAGALALLRDQQNRSPLGLLTLHLAACFFFMTGMHERFLVYAVASAALWAAADPRALWAAALLGLAQLLNLPVNTVKTQLPPAGVTAVGLTAAVCVLLGLVSAVIAFSRPSARGAC